VREFNKMNELRNKQGELTGYETGGGEISINNNIHYPEDWLLTIRSISIHGRVLCRKDKGLEHAKDMAYNFLDEEATKIEKLKKLLV
jgi:hypothetical protein